MKEVRGKREKCKSKEVETRKELQEEDGEERKEEKSGREVRRRQNNSDMLTCGIL